MIVGDYKNISPFWIQLLVEKYTSMILRDYLKRVKSKAVKHLSNFSNRDSIKSVKADARGEVTQEIS